MIVSQWCCKICPDDTCSNVFCCENRSSKNFVTNSPVLTVLFGKLNLLKLGQMILEQKSLKRMPFEQTSLELIKWETMPLEQMSLKLIKLETMAYEQAPVDWPSFEKMPPGQILYHQ